MDALNNGLADVVRGGYAQRWQCIRQLAQRTPHPRSAWAVGDQLKERESIQSQLSVAFLELELTGGVLAVDVPDRLSPCGNPELLPLQQGVHVVERQQEQHQLGLRCPHYIEVPAEPVLPFAAQVHLSQGDLGVGVGLLGGPHQGGVTRM